MSTVGWEQECRKCGGVFSVEERLRCWYSGACGFCGLSEYSDNPPGNVKVRGGVGTIRYYTKFGSSTFHGLSHARLRQFKTKQVVALQLRRGKSLKRRGVAAQVIERQAGARWRMTRVVAGQHASTVVLTKRMAQKAAEQRLEERRRPVVKAGKWCEPPLEAWRRRDRAMKRRRFFEAARSNAQQATWTMPVEDEHFMDVPF